MEGLSVIVPITFIMKSETIGEVLVRESHGTL